MLEENESADGQNQMTLSVDDIESLRLRVQRLEETVAALQNTQEIETRIVERLTQKPAPEPDKPEPPVASVLVRPPTPPPTPVVVTAPEESGWLLFDAVADLKAIWQMFFDLRYHFIWSTRLIVYILVPVVLISHILFPLPSLLLGTTFGGIIDKVLALILTYFIYKALSREARRYRLFVQFNPRR